MAELIDWQFRSLDGKGWQDWVVGSKKVEEHPEEYLSEIEPEPPKHGADVNESIALKSTKEIKSGVLSKPIFGVYLGEKLSDVQNRLKITKEAEANEDKDDPSEYWVVHYYSDILTYYRIGILKDRVVFIQVCFIDNSELNFLSLEEQLKKKYRKVEMEDKDNEFERKFWGTQDGVNVVITLELETTGYKWLSISYTHWELGMEAFKELKEHKTRKLQGDL